MEDTNLFQVIHKTEQLNNLNIIHFTKNFPHKIGVSPILVLSELNLEGAQKQTVLADKLGCTPGAMTNIANKLVKLGFAKRLYNEDDRRHVLMEITEEGRNVFNDAQARGREASQEIFSALSEDELQQYLSLTAKLLDAAIVRNDKV
ncbi:MarR family transcriptional regulator [Kurthia zopfii]|uniref:DNA-binding MarR family transcriptional regulator n=1 Tax=Kurthia zopfii TaxID=1650 RepID=A0A8B4QEJ6_9BACL|nr:MarR family transcriptional regulator [Kurthia zopfii]PWI21335.1 MarR family transcriptional regulator [Kurthia zopfii]TDR34218.1 DNA-binding MarR family transcriptional regulator [Kurthia zopfii]GEK31825.1 MarR family transcriptional regulator [Kurthia zopfii]STX11181.1 Uncharacterized HTH-type transcriptional regulator yusO [Kurthia zopfii]